MKACTKCRVISANYYGDSRASDGLQSQCKACMRERFSANYQKNKEERKAADRAKYERDRAKILAERKRYYYANREVVIARVAAYRFRQGVGPR